MCLSLASSSQPILSITCPWARTTMWLQPSLGQAEGRTQGDGGETWWKEPGFLIDPVEQSHLPTWHGQEINIYLIWAGVFWGHFITAVSITLTKVTHLGFGESASHAVRKASPQERGRDEHWVMLRFFSWHLEVLPPQEVLGWEGRDSSILN